MTGHIRWICPKAKIKAVFAIMFTILALALMVFTLTIAFGLVRFW